MPGILQLDLQQVVSQALSFLLLLWILKRFAWRPLLGILDERRARIEEELRRVAERQQEIAKLQEEYGRRLAAIEEEARGKMQQAVLEGKRIAREIQEEARAEGAAILEKSKETIALEVAKARVTLRDQVAAMTLEALERVLREKLDPASDGRLVEAVLDDLERQEARNVSQGGV